jgi:hypothetical protein
MHSIGQLERFQPFPFAGAAPKTRHNGTKALTSAAFRISGLPKLRIRGRSLGPAAENPWAMWTRRRHR